MLPNNPHPKRIRILLVDDNDFVRTALRSVVESCCEVVGEARDGREAVIRSQECQPDVVLLDITLPDTSGFRLVRGIARSCPRARVIFVSAHTAEPYIREAFRVGAYAYIEKSNVSAHLLPAINAAANGDRLHSVGLRLRDRAGMFGNQFAYENAEAADPAVAADPNQVISRKTRVRVPACSDAEHLLDDFAGSVRWVLKLLEQQFEAVLKGDLTANRFDLLIHEANERKQDAKYAYLSHLQAHGCETHDESRHRWS